MLWAFAVASALPLSAAFPAQPLNATWDTVVALTRDPASQYTGYGRQHSVAVDTGGNVHVVWCDARTSPQRIWYRRHNAGTQTWEPETMLTNLSVSCQRPGIACDEAGNVHVVWHTERYPYYGIWYKRFSAQAATWRPDTLLDSSTSTKLRLYPSICCQLGGNRVHVAWYGLADTGICYQVFHKEWQPGTGWAGAELVTEAPCFHDQVSIAANPDDDLCVAWCGLDLPGVFNQVYCRRRVGGIWQEPELVSDMAVSFTQYAPCACADDSGGFHLVWYGRSDEDFYHRIYHRLRTEGGWTDVYSLTTQADRQQQYPSVACLANGDCHVVWRGQSASSGISQLCYARGTRSGTWTMPERLTAVSDDVCHPGIAAAGSDLHVVWHYNSAGNIDVYYLHGQNGSPVVVSPAVPIDEGGFRITPSVVTGGFAVLRFGSALGTRSLESAVMPVVYDVSGRKVAAFEPLRPDASSVVKLDLGSLPAGAYLLMLESGAVRCCPVQKFLIPGRQWNERQCP